MRVYYWNICNYHISLLYIIFNMKAISLSLKECIFHETEEIVTLLKKPRNRYINDAIDYYNQHQKRLILEQKLQQESESVRENSMNILRDFEDIDYGD